MITVLESIKLSTDYLTGKGIESPRMNAELLLADIIGCKRLELYLSFDKPLREVELQKYREFIRRRGNFEPLQYILGKVEFYGLEFMVNPSVLIPRPETELLVECIIGQSNNEKDQSILDIGCGSGNIAVALAANIEKTKIVATDINEQSIKMAKHNAEINNVSEKIEFICHNILNEDLDVFPVFDVIVSNPPYVSKESFPTLQKEITGFEPRIAVTDENDGFTFYKVIANKASSKLKKKGKLFFEIGENQSENVIRIMEENQFIDVHVIKDYENLDRIVYGEIR